MSGERFAFGSLLAAIRLRGAMTCVGLHRTDVTARKDSARRRSAGVKRRSSLLPCGEVASDESFEFEDVFPVVFDELFSHVVAV